MSIQTLEESTWGTSAVRAVARRIALMLALAMVVAGPFVVGGALGWMLTQEPGPTLGDDGWMRMRPNVAAASVGMPLVSAAELTAAGLSVEDASRILLR